MEDKLTNISTVAKHHIVSIDFILPYESGNFDFVNEEIKVRNVFGFKFKKTIPSHYTKTRFEFVETYTRSEVKEMMSDNEFIGDDGIVYFKPHIRVLLDNNKSLKKYFDDITTCRTIYDILIKQYNNTTDIVFKDWE